jgi:hypothetical protein
MLLILITVSASSHPLDTATVLPDGQSKVLSVIPTGVNGSNSSSSSQLPIKSSTDENRLEITLNIDESDKEVVDNDMGKYFERDKQQSCSTLLICKKVSTLMSSK